MLSLKRQLATVVLKNRKLTCTTLVVKSGQMVIEWVREQWVLEPRLAIQHS